MEETIQNGRIHSRNRQYHQEGLGKWTKTGRHAQILKRMRRAKSVDAALGGRNEARSPFRRTSQMFFPSCFSRNKGKNSSTCKNIHRPDREDDNPNNSMKALSINQDATMGTFANPLTTTIRNLLKELRTFLVPILPEVSIPGLHTNRESRMHVSSSTTDDAIGAHPRVHTIIEYSHILTSDMEDISNAPFYWGQIDRYKAEELLEENPEGTFLLRDSAQQNYLFSVSFRRYDRTLHARVEQKNGTYSFDANDQATFSTRKLTDLVANYKDPKRCFFFEPQLLIPFNRNFAFSLQHLCRSKIASLCTYESVGDLHVPKKLMKYIREYHQPVRIVENEH